MKKTIKFYKKTALICGFIEIVLLAAFIFCYFENYFDLKVKITNDYILIGVSILIFINIIFTWAFIHSVNKIRQHSDLKAAEVIGEDIQEAYNFGMLGLVVTDSNNIILWTNDLFNSRHIDVVDENIFEWQPSLLVLKTNLALDTVLVNINSRIYSVKFISEAGLWIFKDTTEYNNVLQYSKKQAPVIGVLSIDNYDEIVDDEESASEVIMKVKSVIFTYAKEHGILLKRIKDDSYTMICNFEAYSKIKADRFSVIDKVKDLFKDNEIAVTLSMGIAYDFPDVVKLNELASDALDIAMSRGGDQIVVSPYGSEIEFYGGKTEAKEKKNRVKSRVLADSLIAIIKNSSNVLVMGHSKLDMDAAGACLGIVAMCQRVNIPCKMVIDLKNTEIKTRAAITSSFDRNELDEITVSSKNAYDDITDKTLLVVVDCHTADMTMEPGLVENINKIVVIDHHRRGEDYIESPVFNHIDSSASSSCEIITEFIRFSSLNPRIEIPSSFATIMLSGIFLDSSNFKSTSTGIKTFEASTILKEYGADNSLADDFLKDDYEEFLSINEIVSSMDYPYAGIAVALANSDEYYDVGTISKAANTCLSFKGVRASFTIGKIDSKTVKLSARSDGTVNVQYICEKLGGGGHFSMSAVTFEKSTIEEAKDKLYKVLKDELETADSQIAIKEEN